MHYIQHKHPGMTYRIGGWSSSLVRLVDEMLPNKSHPRLMRPQHKRGDVLPLLQV